MKCPSCGYVSFDELNHCKKCGADLTVQEREEGAFSFDESDFEEIVTPLKENEAPGKDEWQLEEISLEGEAAGLAKAKPPAAPAAPPPPRKAGRKANAETVQTQPAPAEPAGDKPVEAESSPAAAEKSQADVIFEKIFDQWETAEPVKPEPPPPRR